MKVPIYNAKQTVSAPQLNTPKVADPIDLSQAINFVENRYEQGVREKEQEEKLFFANETARTELELQKKYAEAQEAIENGDYSALDRYNEFYNQTAKSSVERLSYNPNYAEQAKISYELLGLETGLKLKSAKRQKMKDQTAGIYAEKLASIDTQLSNAESNEARIALIQKRNEIMSRGVAAGIYDASKVPEMTAKAIEDSVQNYAYNKPERFLAELKENPKAFEGVRGIARIEDDAVDIMDENKKRADKQLEILQEQNESLAMDNIVDAEMPYQEKLLTINRMELENQVSQDFAADARRYLKSDRELVSLNRDDFMGEYVQRMYDLPELTRTSQELLEGAANLRKDILTAATRGDLFPEDVKALQNQMRVVLASDISEQTQKQMNVFGSQTRELINMSLPVQYRGEAIRKIFYETLDDDFQKSIEGKEGNDLKNEYAKIAQRVVDEINQSRRNSALKEIAYEVSPEDKGFLTSIGVSIKQVEERARRYNMSVNQIIEILKQQGAVNE